MTPLSNNTLEILKLTNILNSNLSATQFISDIPILDFQIDDFRYVAPQQLFEQKMISRNAYDTLIKGRKWHKEFPSTGAIGLIQSVRRALNNSKDKYTIIFEEDNVCDTNVLYEETKFLIERNIDFDIAVFGATIFGTYTHLHTRKSWLVAGNNEFFYFMRTHCILYHPKIKQKILDVLSEPQEVQYDALLSFLISQQNLRSLFFQGACRQKFHVTSAIQDVCYVCNFSNESFTIILYYSYFLTLCFVIAILYTIRTHVMRYHTYYKVDGK